MLASQTSFHPHPVGLNGAIFQMQEQFPSGMGTHTTSGTGAWQGGEGGTMLGPRGRQQGNPSRRERRGGTLPRTHPSEWEGQLSPLALGSCFLPRALSFQ